VHALIVETLPPGTRPALEALGLQVTERPEITSHTLHGSLSGVDILVVARTRVTRRAIEAGDSLKLIIRAGSGVSTIDVAAASERGVLVSHTAASDAAARCELVLGFALALDRGLHRPAAATSESALGLNGRTLGLCGFDPAARRLAEVAGALGLRVLVWSPTLTPTLASEVGVHYCPTIDALFRDSEILSLHPEGETGTVLATDARIAALPEGASLINASRRGLIDLAAARARLAAGTLRLGLDVYDPDDFGDEVPFARDDFPGLLVTHGLDGHTAEAGDATARTVVAHLERFVLTDRIPDCVNLSETRAGAGALIVRYRPGAGALAAIFAALADAGVHPLTVSTESFDGHGAAFVRVAIDRPLTPSATTAILRNPEIIAAQFRQSASA